MNRTPSPVRRRLTPLSLALAAALGGSFTLPAWAAGTLSAPSVIVTGWPVGSNSAANGAGALLRSAVTANGASAPAQTELTVASLPVAGDQLSIGGCTVSFTAGNGSDSTTCTTSASIYLGGKSSTGQVAAALRALAITDATYGLMVSSGSSSTATFTAANGSVGNPSVQLLGSGSSAFAMNNGTAAVAAAHAASVLSINAVPSVGDTLTIGDCLISFTNSGSDSTSATTSANINVATKASASQVIAALVALTSGSNLPDSNHSGGLKLTVAANNAANIEVVADHDTASAYPNLVLPSSGAAMSRSNTVAGDGTTTPFSTTITLISIPADGDTLVLGDGCTITFSSAGGGQPGGGMPGGGPLPGGGGGGPTTCSSSTSVSTAMASTGSLVTDIAQLSVTDSNFDTLSLSPSGNAITITAGNNHAGAPTITLPATAVGTVAISKGDVTQGSAGTAAVSTLTINSVPGSGSLTLGTCVIHFSAATGSNPTDCNGNSATVLTGGMDANALAAALAGLTGLTDSSLGALSLSNTPGTNTLTVTASAGTGSGSPSYAAGVASSAITASNLVVGGSSLAQVDKITIPATVDIGDVFTLTLPVAGSATSTISYTASSTTAASVAAGLVAAITNSTSGSGPLYAAQPFTVTQGGSNGTTSADLVFTAKSTGTPFTLGNGDSSNAAATAEQMQVTVAGTPASGEVYSLTLNGSSYRYTAVDGDTATAVASGLSAAIGNAALPVSSSASAGVLTITGAASGLAFTASSNLAAAPQLPPEPPPVVVPPIQVLNTGENVTISGGTTLQVDAGTTNAVLTVKADSNNPVVLQTINSTGGSSSLAVSGTFSGSVGADQGLVVSSGSVLVTGSTANQLLVSTSSSSIVGLSNNTQVGLSLSSSSESINVLSGQADVVLPACPKQIQADDSAEGLAADQALQAKAGALADAAQAMVSSYIEWSKPGSAAVTKDNMLSKASNFAETFRSLLFISADHYSELSRLSAKTLGAQRKALADVATRVKVSQSTLSQSLTKEADSTKASLLKLVDAAAEYLTSLSSSGATTASSQPFSSSCKKPSADPLVRRSGTAFAQNAVPADALTLTLYPGESLMLDPATHLPQRIRIAASAQGAGSDASGLGSSRNKALSSNSFTDQSSPNLNATSSRFGATAPTLETALLTATSLPAAAANEWGVYSLPLGDGSAALSFRPVGELLVTPDLPDGLVMLDDGRAMYSYKQVTVRLVPSVVQPYRVVSQQSGAFGVLQADGSYRLKTGGGVLAGGSETVRRPAWLATKTTAIGTIRAADGSVSYNDGQMSVPLLPAVADASALLAVVKTLSPLALMRQDASTGLVSLSINGDLFLFLPDAELRVPPASQAGKAYWSEEGNRVVIRNGDGTAQGFTLK